MDGLPALPARADGRDSGSRAALSAVAWHAQESITFADWVEQGRRLGVMGRSAAWWIGDWLRFGNDAYGERYARAARITGYDVQTLMNMVYVASHVAPSRRRENLSWSHHAEVVALEEAEQERWLDRAEADRLSVRCLREEMRRESRSLSAGSTRRVRELPEPEDEAVVCPTCGHSFAPEEALDVEIEAGGEVVALR